jgi:uncharacterized membrane protein
MMVTVTLYTRKDCHLCEQAQVDLVTLQEDIPHQLVLVDVDNDPKLRKMYGNVVPVVSVGPYSLKAPFDRQDLQITLRAAQHSIQQNQAIDEAIRQGQLPLEQAFTKADRFSFWMARHYLAFFNVLVAFYLGLAFLAPVLMKVGATAPANVIYRVYGFMCHQLAYRSWFLFGEQPAYPRQAAGIKGWVTYEEVTGRDPTNLWDARGFIGDTQFGYKIALCQRDVAIYGAILLFGLAFTLLRRWFPTMPALPWYVWSLFGIVPIGLDGGTQLVSQFFPQLNRIFPYRESTPFLRSLTGVLFGLMTAWFGYPLVEESMVETRQAMQRRLEWLKRGGVKLDT